MDDGTANNHIKILKNLLRDVKSGAVLLGQNEMDAIAAGIKALENGRLVEQIRKLLKESK